MIALTLIISPLLFLLPRANINVATSNSQGPARLPKIKFDKVKQSDIEKFQSFIFNHLNKVDLCNVDVYYVVVVRIVIAMIIKLRLMYYILI